MKLDSDFLVTFSYRIFRDEDLFSEEELARHKKFVMNGVKNTKMEKN